MTVKRYNSTRAHQGAARGWAGGLAAVREETAGEGAHWEGAAASPVGAPAALTGPGFSDRRELSPSASLGVASIQTVDGERDPEGGAPAVLTLVAWE